jgi:enoyl-CoA hydratase/carnithine racemase
MVNNPKHRNRLGKAGKEVKFGIPSGMEACLLPGLIGWGKARELVFTGELMDAQEAHRCGFVDRLVTPGEIDEAVEKWARLSVLPVRAPYVFRKHSFRIGSRCRSRTPCSEASLRWASRALRMSLCV